MISLHLASSPDTIAQPENAAHVCSSAQHLSTKVRYTFIIEIETNADITGTSFAAPEEVEPYLCDEFADIATIFFPGEATVTVSDLCVVCADA